MRIDLEWDVLVQSGQKLGSIGSQIGMLADALGEALGSGIASGIDPAGADFGIKYGRQAQEFADGLAAGTNAHQAVGYMLRATGHNYANADAASTIGGSGSMESVGAPPDEKTAADANGLNGVLVPPPAKWALIQTFLGPMWSWPSGNASMMRITAAQWRNFANGLAAFDGEMLALKAAVSQQHIPEAGKIDDALTDLATGVDHLAESARGMATAIEDFASGVQDTQDAIRALMDRISLDGLWDTVTGFLTGDGDDILREVAHDVEQLLENFQSQVKGVVGLLGELTTLLGSAADAFQKWVRPILVEALGDDVGNAVADYVTWNTDVGVGVVTGLINTVSGVVSLADLDTWKGMAEVAASVVEDPTKLPGVLANMGKEFVAWDEWSGDHPGRAAGEAAFNIGTLFVPGGALTKSGSVAKSLSYASRLFEEGRLPRFSDLPGIGGADRSLLRLDGLPGAGFGWPDVPEFRPGHVPDSLVGPTAPSAIDAPRSPASLEGPGGPPDPPGSTGTPRGPLDSGPGGTAGPMPNPSPVSEAQASAGAPSESQPPAGRHQAGHSTDQPGTTSTTGGPTLTTHEAGNADGQRGSGAEFERGYRPVDDAPSASHRAGSDDVGAIPRDFAHPPTAQHIAEAPADGHSFRHASAVPDDGRALEEPHSTFDDDERPDVASATPVMTGAGSPVAPSVAPGQPHSRISASTSTPQAGVDTTNSKAPQVISPDSTPQRPLATGPGSGAGRTPTAPVHSATSPLAPSGDSGDSARNGHDSRASRINPHEVAGRTDETGSEAVSAAHAIGPDGRYKLSGHGDYREFNGTTIVPEGTTFTTYAEHGSPITDALGNLIESGGDTSRVHSQTFLPGDEVPNYILFPPGDLAIVGTPHTVDRPTLISELLRPNMGDVDFAACLGGWSDRAFDVDCIYDRRTYQPILVYPRPVFDPDEPW